MSWVRSVMAAAALGAGLFLSASVSAAIVVASSGPSAAQYPAGKKLPDNTWIALQKGDSVTVLDARGTKVLRGPGRLAVSQPGRATTNSAFALLTRKDAAGRTRTGAVRTGATGAAPLSPNLWLVDVAKPGTKCVAAGSAVDLWRASAAKAARYRITTSTGVTGTVSFAAGEQVAPWDTGKAPVRDGSSFTLAPDVGAVIGPYTFAVLADPPADPEALALTLIDKGCATQLELLSKTLAITR